MVCYYKHGQTGEFLSQKASIIAIEAFWTPQMESEMVYCSMSRLHQQHRCLTIQYMVSLVPSL